MGFNSGFKGLTTTAKQHLKTNGMDIYVVLRRYQICLFYDDTLGDSDYTGRMIPWLKWKDAGSVNDRPWVFSVTPAP